VERRLAAPPQEPYLHIDNALVSRAISRKKAERVIERRCREPGAKASVEKSRNEKGVPVHSRLRSGGRLSFLSRVLGGAPAANAFFAF